MDKILQWIGSYLGWLDQITGSYIVALLLFAITIEVILLPLAIKRQKTSIKQAKLRPKEMAIQKKYAGRNDQVTRQKMQQEIMEMHQQEGFNQFGGCLLAIIQLPIILALYQIVVDPLKYVLRISSESINIIREYITKGLDIAVGNRSGTLELVSKINELKLEGLEGLKTYTAEGITAEASAAAYESLASIFDKLPDFKIFGDFDLGAIPSFASFDWLLLVPVLTFVTYFLSMKITRKLTYQPTNVAADDKATGCSNAIMDIGMPLFSVSIAFAVPAALGVYWVFKSIISTIQTILLYKLMPLPKFTEEDYKAAEKELAGKNKNKHEKKERDPNAPRVRSLHHIDDEDYDEKGNYIEPPKEPEVKAEDTPVEAAPLKLDDEKRDRNKKKGEAEETPVNEPDSEADKD